MSAQRSMKSAGRKISFWEGVFILFLVYGIFFLIYGFSHLSTVFSTTTGAGEKIWWIAKGLSIIVVVFVIFRGVKKIRGREKPQKADLADTKTNTPSVLPSLLYGIICAGLPTLVVVGLLAYVISPNLVQVPNLFMLPVLLVALYSALRSAEKRAKMVTERKKEPNQGLTSTREMIGVLTLAFILLGLPVYYGLYPNAFTELMEANNQSGALKALLERERSGQSVGEEDLPKDTLLDPGFATSEAGEWVVVFNVHNPHIAKEGGLSPALQNAANGQPLTVSAGSHVTTDVNLSITNIVAGESDGIILSDGSCKPPSIKKQWNKGRYVSPKTCSGNWRTHSNSMRGVYALVFTNMDKVFTVDLYVGGTMKNVPDMKLIAHRKE